MTISLEEFQAVASEAERYRRERDYWMAQAKNAAQRQREACAKAVLADYAAGELTPAAVTRACRIIQQTPMVTEDDK